MGLFFYFFSQRNASVRSSGSHQITEREPEVLLQKGHLIRSLEFCENCKITFQKQFFIKVFVELRFYIETGSLIFENRGYDQIHTLAEANVLLPS